MAASLGVLLILGGCKGAPGQQTLDVLVQDAATGQPLPGAAIVVSYTDPHHPTDIVGTLFASDLKADTWKADEHGAARVQFALNRPNLIEAWAKGHVPESQQIDDPAPRSIILKLAPIAAP
jgi:hypothetical protein